MGDGGWGMGDWGLGIGDWAQSPIPNPQSPIPNPQSPGKLKKLHIDKYIINIYQKINIYLLNMNYFGKIISRINGRNHLNLFYTFILFYCCALKNPILKYNSSSIAI